MAVRGLRDQPPRKLYRKLVNAPAGVEIGDGELRVRFEKRSHNPILEEAGLGRPTPPIP